VGLGRPILYGLAAEGRDGVRELIIEITAEIKRIMSLIGAEQPDKLTMDMLVEDP
jgi:4-hydroxymandelate oxidase